MERARTILAVALTLALARTAFAESWLALEVHGAAGAAPSVGGGAGLEAGGRRGRLGLALGVRFDRRAALGPVTGARSTVLALGCAFLAIEVCAGVEGGAFSGDGPGLAGGHREHAPQLGGVLRIGAPFALARQVVLVPWASLGVPVYRVTLLDDATDERYWRQPAVDGALGVALRVTLP